MKRSLLILLVITGFCIFFASCAWISRNYDWKNVSNTFFKQDIYSPYGQMAAVWNDRLYYVDNRMINDGVYSMDTTGKDVRFEFSSPKIVKLIFSDNAIYYVGLCSTGRNKEKIYGLYEYNKDEKNANLIAGDGRLDSIYNVIMTTKGDVFYRTIIGIGSSAGFNTYTYGINNNGSDELVSKGVVELVNSDTCEIQLYDNYIITMYNDETRPSSFNNSIGGPDDSIYNIGTRENLMWDAWHGSNCDVKVIYSNEAKLYLANNNDLVIINRDSMEIEEVIEFSELDSISTLDFAIESNNKLYLIFTLAGNKQELYVMDMETLACEQLNSFDSESILINIQDGCILYAKGDKVYCQNADMNGLGAIEYEIEFRKNIVENNVFEVAANWLFIYDRGKPSKTTPYELLYKVNLETQQIINN